MKKKLLILCVLSTYLSLGSYSQTDEELQEIKNIISTIWNNNKDSLTRTISSKLEDRNTTVLYNIQAQTNNLLIYAFNENEYALLDELAEVYMTAYWQLGNLNTKVVGSCKVDFREPRLAWLSGDSTEVVLNSSQFLYLITKAIHYAVSIPETELNNHPNIVNLVDYYTPVVMDHYQRWLTVDSTFQVKAWGCNPGSYNHLEFLQMKLQNALGEQREYCNSVTAHDMWIIAGVAELLGANFKNPSLVRLTSFNKQIFLEHIKVGSELISNRLITNESNLTNFEGENVLGLIFEPHALPNKDSYLYAGNTNPDCPPSESLVTSISWDISHARRWVHVFESLYSNRNVSAQSFPSKFVMQKISNQFLYGVFNKDFTMPLFSNYFDGKNGWYRFGYKNRVGWGYAPYDLSISAITGGYCFWSKYNSDFDLLRNSLWQMINTKDQAIINHVTDHFGTRYSSCVKKENRDFDHLNAKEKSIDLLQFLPTFFPAKEKTLDQLITCVTKNDSAWIFKSSIKNTLGSQLYGPNNFWDISTITSGDYDGDGDDELITAFHSKSQDAIYINEEGDGSGFNKRIYSSSRWDIVAMTSGDFDGDGVDEFVTALRSDKGNVIYINEVGNQQVSNKKVFSSRDWDIVAMTSGDFDGDNKDELIITTTDHCNVTRIFIKKNGIRKKLLLIYQSQEWSVVDIISGDFDGDGDDELVTAFRNAKSDAIYLNENAKNPASQRVYSTNYWKVGSLASGDFDGDGDDELVTGFNSKEGGALYLSEDAFSPSSLCIYEADPELQITHLHSGDFQGSLKRSLTNVVRDAAFDSTDFITFSTDLISIFPNPSKGEFQIEINGQIVSEIKIINLQGQEVSFKLKDKFILLNDHTKGIYIIRGLIDNVIWHKKLVIE